MAAEAVLGGIGGKLCEKIWDYTVDPIVRQFSYVCCFNRNIEELKTQLKKLQLITQGVKQQVDADHARLKDAAPLIKDWLERANAVESELGEIIKEKALLKRADDVESEVGEIIKEKPEVKKGCLNGGCPNLKLRYSLSRKAVKKTKVIVDLQKEVEKYVPIPISSDPPPACMSTTIPSEDSMAFESRSRIMEEIIKALEDDKINLIGIHGLPGVGKTTIAKDIRKRAIKDGLFLEVPWAVVSQTPNMTNVQDCIANMLGLKQFGDNQSHEARADLLSKRLLQDNKKILVILDDVWEEFDLRDKGIPLGGANKNFKMLYTSRNRDLWLNQEITKIEIPLEPLSKNEAWKLFKKQVGDCVDAPDLQPIAKDIVDACRCLPLALVLIGKALSKKKCGNLTKNIWEDMRYRLTCSSSTLVDKSLSSSLELSYRAVEDEEARRLFLLCCLFEEDKSISIENLARYAWGFSLFDGIKEIRNSRDRVVNLVADLESRYLLLDDPDKSYHKHVKVHDLVRDMGIYIASKYKGALGSHGTVSEYPNPKKDAYEYALVSHDAVSKWPNKDKFQHYTCILVNSEEITELPEELTCPNLEFLLLRCWIPENLSCHFFKGTEKLKVLELYEYDGIIPTLQPLTNLTMLSLEGSYYDRDIVPIGDLVNLEILSFRNLNIKELPDEIGKLEKLRLLDLTGTKRLCRVPSGVISHLGGIEELYMMDSEFCRHWEGDGEEEGNANLREFERLSNLNTLEISIRGSRVLIPRVPIFSKLKKYKVIIESSEIARNFGGTQYERELFVGRWPGWDILVDHGWLDSLLRSSDHIWFQENDLVRLLDGVDRLQQLKCLEIKECKTPECLVNTMNSVQQQPNVAATAIFPILEKLSLKSINDLREICNGPIPAGSFGQLTKIKIIWCGSLKYLFPLPIVECLTQLRSLHIRYCDMMEEVIWKEEREGVQIATNNRIEFPKLEKLRLDYLPSLMGFCRGIDQIDFPRLKDISLEHLPRLKSIVHNNSNPSSNSETNNNVGSLSFFPQMVTFRSLEKLTILSLNVRNVFNHSMATVLVNLQILTVGHCPMMKTIVAWERGQERERTKTLFPQLMKLELTNLPRLTRFGHFTHPIELPLLSKIEILLCCSMTAFFFRRVIAPNFYFQGVSGNIEHAIEFMQKEQRQVVDREEEMWTAMLEYRTMMEEQRKEEERRKKETEEMAKGKGWPMKVKHEFHEHNLEPIQRWRYICDGCEERGKDWSFYCKDCAFDLHPMCALEENKTTKGDNEGGLEEGATTKGWPKKVKHELHEHELELIIRWNYICDGCKERGHLWSFYCKYCDFGLHRKCALEQNKATKGDNEDGLEEGATTKEGWVCN